MRGAQIDLMFRGVPPLRVEARFSSWHRGTVAATNLLVPS